MSQESEPTRTTLRQILEMVQQGRLEPDEAETLISGLLEQAGSREERSSSPRLQEIMKSVEQAVADAARWGREVAAEAAQRIQDTMSPDEEAAGACFGEEDRLDHEEAAEGLEAIEVTNVNGAITLVALDEEVVRLTATRPTGDETRGRQPQGRRETGLEIRREGGTLVVRTKAPSHHHLLHGEAFTVDYALHIPARLAVRARTVNGAVRATGMEGGARLTTVNGDIHLAAGDGYAGETRLKVVNGSIDMWVPRLTAEAALKTVNGKIEATVAESLEAELAAKTLHGDLDLSVPRGAAFSLSAKAGMTGDIQTDWGEGRRSLQREVNGGGVSVSLKTLSGAVRVRQLGREPAVEVEVGTGDEGDLEDEGPGREIEI